MRNLNGNLLDEVVDKLRDKSKNTKNNDISSDRIASNAEKLFDDDAGVCISIPIIEDNVITDRVVYTKNNKDGVWNKL